MARLDRYREHDIELPVGELKVRPLGETASRSLVERALDYGNGTMKLAADQEELNFSTPRACPSAAAASSCRTRGSSPSTRSTAGARAATAPAC